MSVHDVGEFLIRYERSTISGRSRVVIYGVNCYFIIPVYLLRNSLTKSREYDDYIYIFKGVVNVARLRRLAVVSIGLFRKPSSLYRQRVTTVRILVFPVSRLCFGLSNHLRSSGTRARRNFNNRIYFVRLFASKTNIVKSSELRR